MFGRIISIHPAFQESVIMLECAERKGGGRLEKATSLESVSRPQQGIVVDYYDFWGTDKNAFRERLLADMG